MACTILGLPMGPHWSTTQRSDPFLALNFLFVSLCRGIVILFEWNLTPLKCSNMCIFLGTFAVIDFHIAYLKVFRGTGEVAQ